MQLWRCNLDTFQTSCAKPAQKRYRYENKHYKTWLSQDKCYLISQSHLSLPLFGNRPKKLTLFTRLFLTWRHVQAGHKVRRSCYKLLNKVYQNLLNGGEVYWLCSQVWMQQVQLLYCWHTFGWGSHTRWEPSTLYCYHRTRSGYICNCMDKRYSILKKFTQNSCNNI